MRTISGKESHLLSITRSISGYTTSLEEMSGYIVLKGGVFSTRPIIGFFTNSLIPLTSLLPGALPTGNVIINVLLLANSDSFFILEYIEKDNSKIMTFHQFQTRISSFGQSLIVQTSTFDKILCLKNGKFDLIRISSEELFSVQNTSRISHAYSLFTNIKNKEKSILTKLQQFHDMYESSSFSHHLSKRNILDIFSPYSINQIGTTSNNNFKLMNKNFNTMQSISKKLYHSQNKIAKAVKDLGADDKKLHYQTLFLEYTDIANQLHEAFVYSLAEIIKSIQPSRTIKIIFNLMTSSSYCELNQCFSAPIFNQINKTHLQVQFSKTYQTLQKAIFLSCTIYHDMTTSIYSHSLGFLTKNGTLNFDNKKLSSIPISFISNANIDSVRRPIKKDDLIQEMIYPIYKNHEVSLQCLNITKIKVQNKVLNCDPFGLQWISAPSNIEIHGKTVNFFSENHVTSSLQLYQNNLKKLNSFQNNTYVHSTLSKITDFFTHPSTDLKLASFISSGLATIFLAITCLLCSACCCPSLLTSCLQGCCLCGCKVGSYISNWITNKLQKLASAPSSRTPPEEHPLTPTTSSTTMPATNTSPIPRLNIMNPIV